MKTEKNELDDFITKKQPEEDIYYSYEEMERYQNKGFNTDQLYEILFGFADGLTKKEIDIYADPKFNSFQMEQLRLGLGYMPNITIDQVKEYARKEFPSERMRRYRLGLMDKN